MAGSTDSMQDEKHGTKEIEVRRIFEISLTGQRITTDMQVDDRIEFGWRTVVALLSMLLLKCAIR